MVLQGECNCGAIKLEVPDDIQTAYCRCMNCRKQSGAVGSYVSGVKDEDIKMTGTPKVYLDKKTDSGKDLKRLFCGDCGSPIMSESLNVPGKKYVKMGLFENFPKPVAEVYIKNKPDWEPHMEGTVRLNTV